VSHPAELSQSDVRRFHFPAARLLRAPALLIALLLALAALSAPRSASGQAGPSQAAAGQPLPDGEGRELVQFHCSICHDLAIVRQQRLTRPVWNRILDDMRKNGAVFTEEQRQTILDYLAKHLGP
jgi:Spy/CpxP family protein refolding chaperone